MTTSPPPPPPPPVGPGMSHAPATSQRELASWGSRALAWTVDTLVAAGPTVVALLVVGGTSGLDGSGAGILLVGYLATILVAALNLGWRQGTTGQSIGKGLVDIAVVGADDGQPIGLGLGVARWLVAGFLGGLCLLDYLWPLWDERNRAWHDMVLDTSVVRT